MVLSASRPAHMLTSLSCLIRLDMTRKQMITGRNRLLDELLRGFDYSEKHSIDIDAPKDKIMKAVCAWRFRDDRLVSAAITLRETPARLLGLPTKPPLEITDFATLGRCGNDALVLGLIGALWKADYGLKEALTAEKFRAERHDDVCKLAVGFAIESISPRTNRLVTETRVKCLTPFAQRRFAPYWYLIRPVSGIIRRRMLSAVRARSLMCLG